MSVRPPAAGADGEAAGGAAGAGAAGAGAGAEAAGAGAGAAGAGACGARISNVLGRALLNFGVAFTATDPRTKANLINRAIPGIAMEDGEDRRLACRLYAEVKKNGQEAKSPTRDGLVPAKECRKA